MEQSGHTKGGCKLGHAPRPSLVLVFDRVLVDELSTEIAFPSILTNYQENVAKIRERKDRNTDYNDPERKGLRETVAVDVEV